MDMKKQMRIIFWILLVAVLYFWGGYKFGKYVTTQKWELDKGKWYRTIDSLSKIKE